MLNFPFLNWVLHRSRYVFDGHVRINTMLIEQIDGIDPESLERGLGDLPDVLGPTIKGWRSLHSSGIGFRTEVKTELRGNHHLIAFRTTLLINIIYL